MIKKIYLHWTAGRYNQIFDDYHICIEGNGTIHLMDNFAEYKPHTWHRNTNAIGIALSCCYGANIDGNGNISWGDYPPTYKQIETLTQLLTILVQAFHLDINNDVLTHAEAAELDGYGLNSTDPDIRWDLLRIPQSKNIPGGNYIRHLVRKEMEKWN